MFWLGKLLRLWFHYFVTLWFSNSGAVRWNSVEIEFQNPSLAARPSPSASLIISVNLLIKMSCKRFPSFHSDHYQHARAPRWIPELLSPLRGEHIQSTRSANRFEKVTKGFESQENVECYNKPALWRRWRCFDDWEKLFYGFAGWSMRQISWANAGFSLGRESTAASWRDQACRGSRTQIGTRGIRALDTNRDTESMESKF